MHLHIVGGFLGSGKTTAIIGAAKHLMAQGKRVGVITNDQGRFLVDTAFMRASDIPAVEVTSGCFCCNYKNLEDRLDQLTAAFRPDIVFAESVGSCADIVATVLKPLLELRSESGGPSSFTVFTDIRLLRRRLLGQPLPFSEKVTYIFDKQLEEAGLIVLNKSDTLDDTARDEIEALASERFPGVRLRMQNSHDPAQTASWTELLESGVLPLPARSLDIDYNRYGEGERQLAWLNEVVTLLPPAGRERDAATRFIEEVANGIEARRLPVGHFKFLVQSGSDTVKVSLVAGGSYGWRDSIPELNPGEIRILVNARVESDSGVIREIVSHALECMRAETGTAYHESDAEAFHPGLPRPTHRIG